MGSPFETATWNGVTGAYFTGAGGGMVWVWLLIAIALCIVPLFVGHRHEKAAYERMARTRREDGDAIPG